MARSTTALALTALFAALMAVSAFIRIPAGPVPLTLQSTAALLAGYCLGPGRGAAAMSLYIAVGLAGLPVFASGGGPAYVLAPTFGYILGFIPCAAVTGLLARFNRRGSKAAAYVIMLAGLAALYIPGVLWLAFSLERLYGASPDIAAILRTGLFIPLAGDLLKTIPAAIIAPRVRALIERQ